MTLSSRCRRPPARPADACPATARTRFRRRHGLATTRSRFGTFSTRRLRRPPVRMEVCAAFSHATMALSIAAPVGYGASSCRYCTPPGSGERSEGDTSCSYGIWVGTQGRCSRATHTAGIPAAAGALPDACGPRMAPFWRIRVQAGQRAHLLPAAFDPVRAERDGALLTASGCRRTASA